MRQPRRNSPSSLSQRSGRTSDSSEKGSESSRRCDGLKPTRKRASKPKVRTGCISCKRRHVKCDEGKPSCAECERLGLMCEGYAPPKVKTASCRPERLLLPKPKLASVQPSKIAALSQSVDYRSPTPQMPTFGFELSEDDKWYFSLFRDQISHELSPYFRSTFWSHTSLRDSMVNRCIHHSILSIGAYGRALMDLREGYAANGKSCRTWWPPSVMNRHHQAALVHHAKALSHLRSNIRSYGIDGRLTMAATLLFIVFENMQGNYLSSGNLIRSGIKVLRNIRGADYSKSILRRQWYRCLSTPRDEVDEMTLMFARHSVATACIPFSHGKFAYHILLTEDEDEDGDTGLDGPFTFSPPQTLEQTRQIWDHLIVQISSFTSKIAWHNSNPDYDFDEPAAFREQAMYLAQLNDLGVALDSLLFSTVDTRDRQGLELLRLQHTIAYVGASCCFDSTEMMYDQYIPQFEDVVQRCKRFTDFPSEVSTKVGFINEIGRLPLLAFVGMKCRKASVRQEAVNLLTRCDWRESTWDSENVANVVTGIMKLEGQLDPADPEYTVPAEKRYVWTNIFWDFEKRQMLLEYTKALPNELGEFDKVSYVTGV
ncbi:hypothetical protein F4774DRAFT_192797 [Daldinia eschscholtzii]|nr:hypothetical protein F4774DRAFT_192797 [Daldinia eschscholtzii]